MKLQHIEINYEPLKGVPELTEPLFQEMLASWFHDFEEKSCIPDKASLDPSHFKLSLPYSWIYEYLPDQDDFYCRLSGSEIDGAWGQNLTTHRLSEIFSEEDYQESKKRLKQVLEAPAILHGRFFQSMDSPAVERLAFPLLDEDGKCRYVIGISKYQYIPGRFRENGEKDFLRFYQI